MGEMPRRRIRGERLLEDALDSLARALTESGAPWMVIGGIAVIARGVRRFTTDIDATVRGDAVPPENLLAILQNHGIAPRIHDALPFAEANLVFLLRHEPTGVDIDVSFAWSGFEHDALDACTPIRFGRVRIPMCTAEDLVVFKAIAGRPKDLEDAEALLALYPDIDVVRTRRHVAELAALADAPELVEAFDAMAGEARETTTPYTAPHPVPRAPKGRGRRRKRQ